MGRIRVVLDTNIFIKGAFHEESNKESAQLKSIHLGRNKKFKLILSGEIVEQINRVAKRLRGKDFAGLLQYHTWSDFDIEFVPDEVYKKLKKKYKGKVPRKDLGIFVTAIGGEADYLVSDNRKFLRKASKQNIFKCINPEEFVKGFE